MPKPIPDGLHTITPALALEGCADAIEFFKRAFGAVEEQRSPDPTGKKIWHAVLRINDSTLFVNDVFPEMGGRPFPAQLWLYTANVDAAYKRAVDAGAKSLMPLADMFWGDRMGKLGDRWGNEWNISERKRELSPDEMKRAQEQFIAAEMARKRK